MASQLGTHYHGSSGGRSSLSGRDGDRTQCTRGPRLSRRSLDDPDITRRSQGDAKVQDRLRTQRGCYARNAARRCETQEFQTVKGKALCEINCISPCPATIEIQTSFPPGSARTCVGFRVRSVTRVDETRRFATQSTASPAPTAAAGCSGILWLFMAISAPLPSCGVQSIFCIFVFLVSRRVLIRRLRTRFRIAVRANAIARRSRQVKATRDLDAERAAQEYQAKKLVPSFKEKSP
jgi:hypothetical protein